MKLEDFETISKKIEPYAKLVYLHKWGEPLMNKKILLMGSDSYVGKSLNELFSNSNKTVTLFDKIISYDFSEFKLPIDISIELVNKFLIKNDFNKPPQGMYL